MTGDPLDRIAARWQPLQNQTGTQISTADRNDVLTLVEIARAAREIAESERWVQAGPLIDKARAALARLDGPR